MLKKSSKNPPIMDKPLSYFELRLGNVVAKRVHAQRNNDKLLTELVQLASALWTTLDKVKSITLAFSYSESAEEDLIVTFNRDFI